MIITVIAIIAGVFFRIVGLGYSDFQGDEVSAQNFLFDNRSFLNFLLTRTIGPGQFIVTKIVNDLFHTSNLEFWVRLPFCLAGIASLFLIYFITRKIYNEKAAFVATTFASLSGLLIAFSRIAQYQSFIVLLSLLSIYFIYKFQNRHKEKLLIISGVLSGTALLFHYDALSFVIPIAIFLLVRGNLKNFWVYTITTAVLCGLYYIPFVLNPTFRTTLKYVLAERIAPGFKYDSIYYSGLLFSLYHSREYIITILLSILLIFTSAFKKSRSLLTATAVLVIVRWGLIYQHKILILLSILISGLYFLKTLKNQDLISTWFAFSGLTYLLIISKPLTHFYVVLIPFFIIIGDSVSNLKVRNKNGIYLLTIFFLVSAISFNYNAFINTKPEYPWNIKSYIYGKMPTTVVNNEEIKGVFGFPYNRKWKEVSNLAKEIQTKYGYATYASNEKYRLTKYYIRNLKWFDGDPDVYISIENPQNLIPPVDVSKSMVVFTKSDKYTIFVRNAFVGKLSFEDISE